MAHSCSVPFIVPVSQFPLCLCERAWWQNVSPAQHGHSLTAAEVVDPIRSQRACWFLTLRGEHRKLLIKHPRQLRRNRFWQSAIYDLRVIPRHDGYWILPHCHFCFVANNIGIHFYRSTTQTHSQSVWTQQQWTHWNHAFMVYSCTSWNCTGLATLRW